MNTLQDRIRGSLIGGAIGDALGYPVEFIYSFGEIQKRYGERGITRLDTRQHWLDETEQVGKAVVSDDTQMTLFTANGLLNAKKQGISLKYGICRAYIEWYLTQIGKKSPKYKDCWISDVPELNHRRAPGNTCMTSLDDIYRGKDPMNNSKGCGDVERMAELAERAIYLLNSGKTDLENIGHLGEGWTGEEALAIALYCTLKHFDSFEDAMIAAVNHGRDSDSTGAVTGNILGAAVGYEVIPQYYKDDLEMHGLILHMADDLYQGEITRM